MTTSPRLSILTSAFQSESYLASFIGEVQRQTVFDQLELVLVLNEPSTAEKKTAQRFAAQYPQQVQILEVAQVETLGASWNRAWRAARAPYLAPWNVDDRRAPDSLERQLNALESHPDWALAYGDYVAVPAYGAEQGLRRYTPPYSPALFRRAFPQGGGFWVFRSNVAEQAGYFDEQFKVGPDFDLSVRMAAAGQPMGRVEGLLGYFTDAQQGLSTREAASGSAIDRTAIQLRYAIFDKVDRRLILATQIYELDRYLAFGEWQRLEAVLPGYQAHLILRSPLWLLGWLRHLGRSLLRRLGLLEALHRLIERVWRREV